MGRENSIYETLVSCCFASVMDPNSVAEKRIERVKWCPYLQDDFGRSSVMACMSTLPFWALVLCVYSVKFCFLWKLSLPQSFGTCRLLVGTVNKGGTFRGALSENASPKQRYLNIVFCFLLQLFLKLSYRSFTNLYSLSFCKLPMMGNVNRAAPASSSSTKMWPSIESSMFSLSRQINTFWQVTC